MSTIQSALSNISIGPSQSKGDLFMFPIISSQEPQEEREYLLLDEALETEQFRVTEVSESGSVPELLAFNDTEKPVLLLDGEELIGAKQNRILNLTVLVPAKSKLNIPVSCVEQGRWHARSTEFASAGRAHFARGRMRKMKSVSEQMRSEMMSRRSNQSEVWDSVAEAQVSMCASSPTSASEALHQKARPRLDEFHQAFLAVDKQVGTVFVRSGAVVGMDLFDHTTTLQKLLPKLVESYGVDSIAFDQPLKATKANNIEEFLGLVESSGVDAHKAIGLGNDLRLDGRKITGAALEESARVIHLCAFMDEDSESSDSMSASSTSRMAGAMRRRGNISRRSRHEGKQE